MIDSKQPHLFAYLLFILPSILSAAPTVVSVSGRKLLVSGSTFTVKGVNYSPTPYGSTLVGSGGGCSGNYQWWTDRPAYRTDFPLIRQMGANTIRTYNLLNSAATQAEVLDALDEAYANGIYVIASYFVSTFGVIDQVTVTNEVLASVNAYKNHPAILMWAIGNEQNLNNGNNTTWYNFLNTLAGQIKAADANHPVMSVEGEILLGTDFNVGNAGVQAADVNMTNLDVWGINIYRGPSFQGYIETVAGRTSKPLLITEFGKDAYNDTSGAEDESLQAGHLSSQWGEINSRLNVSISTNPLVGAVVFEWTDEWWKDASGGLSCLSHGTDFFFTRPVGDPADPTYNEEWFGLVAVEPVNATTNPAGTLRRTRAAYTTLQGLWGVVTTSASSSLPFFNDTVRNYPNPIRLGRGSTRFVVEVNKIGTVGIDIYDAAGQRVVSLEPLTFTGAGRQERLWDGRNSQGEQVGPGVYLAKIAGHHSGGEEVQYRKVAAVK